MLTDAVIRVKQILSVKYSLSVIKARCLYNHYLWYNRQLAVIYKTNHWLRRLHSLQNYALHLRALDLKILFSRKDLVHFKSKGAK